MSKSDLEVSKTDSKPDSKIRDSEVSKTDSKSCVFRKSFLFNSYAGFTEALQRYKQQWWLLDAKDLVLGRLAVKVACLLQGKHKPCYAPFYPCGDKVIIINIKSIHMTGNKMDSKVYYRHSGYPGGLKTTNPSKILNSHQPEKLMRLAVRRMLPRGPLGLQLLKNMYVYGDDKHQHAAQNPRLLDFAKIHQANVKRTKKL